MMAAAKVDPFHPADKFAKLSSTPAASLRESAFSSQSV
jgi:hypothetical protein